MNTKHIMRYKENLFYYLRQYDPDTLQIHVHSDPCIKLEVKGKIEIFLVEVTEVSDKNKKSNFKLADWTGK